MNHFLMMQYEMTWNNHYLRRYANEDLAREALERIAREALACKWVDLNTVHVSNRYFFPDRSAVYAIRPVHS